MKTKTALTDVKTLRVRARKDIEGGAVTAGYSADRTQGLKLLNEHWQLKSSVFFVTGDITLWLAVSMQKAPRTSSWFTLTKSRDMPTRLPNASYNWAASRISHRIVSPTAVTRNTYPAPL